MQQYTARYSEILPEEFSVAYKSAEQCEKTTFHLHSQLELIYSMSDNMILGTETETIPIPKHHIILLSCRDLHYLYCEKNTGLCNRYVIYFPPQYVAHFSAPEFNIFQCFNVRTKNRPNILSVPEDQQGVFIQLLDQLNALFHHNSFPSSNMEPILAEQYTKLVLGQLLILTNNLFASQFQHTLSPTVVKHHLIAAEIAEYIQGKLSEELNVDVISKQFYISKTQLYYLFTEVYGMTLSEYVSELRMTKAKNLLINSEYPMDYIAQAVGYQNSASFSRAFKSKTCCSPQKYRKENTNQTSARVSSSWVNIL